MQGLVGGGGRPLAPGLCAGNPQQQILHRPANRVRMAASARGRSRATVAAGYYLSKFYEFVDTAILVLRSKPTSLLHVVHHALVLVMAWLWVDQRQSLQWGGLLTNTLLHVVMYWYYFLACRVRTRQLLCT